jgi:hypothetical protein
MIERELAAAAAGDVPPQALRVVAPTVSPDGLRAGALVLYATEPEPTPFDAFFVGGDGKWVEIGQTDGVGPGEWDFGDLSYPYLSGRVAGGPAVEIRLGPETIRCPVVEGWFLGVFWQAGLPFGDPGLEADDARTPRLYRTVS